MISAEMIPPERVTIAARSFRWIGINGSGIVGNIVQLIEAPPVIAPIDRNNVGIVTFRSLLLVWWSGEDIEGDQTRDIIKRIEYAEVRAVEKNRRMRIIILVLFAVESSRIMSLE